MRGTEWGTPGVPEHPGSLQLGHGDGWASVETDICPPAGFLLVPWGAWWQPPAHTVLTTS